MDSGLGMKEEEDFCNSVLSRFSNSSDQQHHHICSIIADISQGLKDHGHPLTPLAYFGATSASLDKLLLSADHNSTSHHLHALLTIISMLLPTISSALLRKEFDYVSALLTRVIHSHAVTDSVIVSCLKCISHMLIVGHRTSWSDDVSPLFQILLQFIVDSRLKVRRQAHVSLRDVMQGFQETSVLSPASEAIASKFENIYLFAGGANSNPNPNPQEGSRAQDVLYVLDSLKDTLPLMPSKFSTKILSYFKRLLALHQSAATRRITDALYLLCLQPSLDVSSEALVDLLCSLATEVSSNEMSGDNLTFTARLLDAGMKKVFSVNRQICVVKLPVVFSALKDILASEHEEPLSVAVDALKSLIHTCIDDIMIKQGVDQIIASGSVRKSAPTIIEKLCATVESLLDYRFAAVWDMSFQVVAAMFDRIGSEFSSYFLKGTLKSLEGIQKLPDEDFLYRKQLHDCMGVAVVALGPETFLKCLPLNVEAQDPSDTNVWLFPILKQNIVGARLSFFNEYILDSIRVLKLRSAKVQAVFWLIFYIMFHPLYLHVHMCQHEQEGRIHSARSVDGLVYSLWSLLPSFCNYPLDTAESFKDLETMLCRSLREESDFRGIICSSLHILIQQNKRIIEGEIDSSDKINISQQQAVPLYTSEVAACNLDVLRSSASAILSTLSGTFMKSAKDDGGSLQRTIGDFASIADKSVVSKLYKNTMNKLLKVTKEAGKIQNIKGSGSMEIDNSSNDTSLSLKRGKLYDLAVALLPGIGTEEIDLLFVAIEPALKDTESLIQKKAYKVLSTILEHDDSFIARRFEQLLKLMFEVMHTCHFSAKRHRLDCLYFLIAHVSKDKSEQMKREIVASFLTEIILGLKESNKKTRNRAYEIIVQIGHACADEDKGGNNENLYNFFNMVAGGLAGETPHMIGAAVKGMARLTYEFNDLLSNAFIVLPSTLLLLQRKSREINKAKKFLLLQASLGFLKVLVAKSQAEGLQTHMRGMVEAILRWQSSSKNHFKAKVKQLLEMLVKKCGLVAVKEVMPEEHMKLLTNIRKINERKERKHSANTTRKPNPVHQKQPPQGCLLSVSYLLSRWNHTKIFSDFSDEKTDNGNSEDMTFAGRRSSKKSSFKSKRAKRRLAEDSYEELEDEPLDLLDREKTRSSLRSFDSLKRKLQSIDEPEIDADGRLIISEDDRRETTEAATGKTSQSGWAYTGSEYSSKKAGGDLKRKGKLEPYAYWPLDRKMVSRRPEHRATARKGMSSVVKRLEGQSVSNALAIKGFKMKRSKRKAATR
ncbi:hypothetical protein E3N88_09823 [Mikania micrantha]|uniref:Ribosomal RNA-processing protein 12-like conserved domain-containing protein n=1 Tax=Mikania micrantha TaxID=192012 RepID=A0A5N6PL31_9ASTR|nr:hypothetical protein E3N88_09823 [Mikania micrantha]